MTFREAVLFVNNRCNFNCYHCYVDKKEGKELSKEKLEYFIENCISKYSLQRINIVGGEPFLYSHLRLLLNKLKDRKDVELIITTNGSLFFEKMIEPLQSANIRLIKISLHSLKPDIFSIFSGTNDKYSKVLQNIQSFTKYFDIGINVTLTKLNYQEIDEIIKFGIKSGVKYFHISQLTPSGKGISILSEKLEQNEIKSVKEKLDKYASTSINYDDHSSCSFGQKLCIDPEGDIYACPAIISYKQYKIGNLYSSENEIIMKIKEFNSQRTKKCFVDEFINNK